MGGCKKCQYLPGYRNVPSIQTGNVYGQSYFMRNKRLWPTPAARMIRANQVLDGSTIRIQAEWIDSWRGREWTSRKCGRSNDTPFAAYQHTPHRAS